MEETIDYRKDVEIDDSALDIEWLNQAELAVKYGVHFAYTQRQLRRAEEIKKTLRSTLIREASTDPMKHCGKAKPTQTDLEAYYRTNKKYMQAVEDLVEAEYEKSIAEIAKNEICFTRKAALENLVVLHGQQYFAGPAVPRNLKEQREMANEKTNLKTAKGMKRKVKK